MPSDLSSDAPSDAPSDVPADVPADVLSGLPRDVAFDTPSDLAAHDADRAEAGRLLAVSVGEPRKVEWRGETIRTAIFKRPVETPVRVGRLGLVGDGQADLSVHGGVDKAVYAFDDASRRFWSEALGRAPFGPGEFGENLTLEGWPEDRVRIGDRFRIGSVLLEVSQPRQPCMKLGLRFDDPTFPKRFIQSGRVGYYLRVLEEGEIRSGQPVRREATDISALDVKALVSIWLDRRASPASLERAVALSTLADAWRTPLADRLARGRTESTL